MSPDAAGKLLSLSRRQGDEWDELLSELKASCDTAEFNELKHIVLMVLDTHYDEVLRPILEAGEKFMSPEAAEKFLALALRQSGEWNQLLIDLEGSCGTVEFTKLKSVVGKILAAYYDEVLTPVLAEHPHLKPPGLFE
jgi:hypothetical protein